MNTNERDPRLDQAVDYSGYSQIGSFVSVLNQDNAEVVMIVLDRYEFFERYEQSSSDRRQSGWYIRCVEPNDTEKQTPEYIAIAQQIAERQATSDRIRKSENRLAREKFGTRTSRTKEYWDARREYWNNLPPELRALPDPELDNDYYQGDAE